MADTDPTSVTPVTADTSLPATSLPPSRDLLTVEQVAAHLQMSQSSVRSYIRQGKLKAFRLAGLRKVLIPREAMMALLEPARDEPEA